MSEETPKLPPLRFRDLNETVRDAKAAIGSIIPPSLFHVGMVAKERPLWEQALDALSQLDADMPLGEWKWRKFIYPDWEPERLAFAKAQVRQVVDALDVLDEMYNVRVDRPDPDEPGESFPFRVVLITWGEYLGSNDSEIAAEMKRTYGPTEESQDTYRKLPRE